VDRLEAYVRLVLARELRRRELRRVLVACLDAGVDVQEIYGAGGDALLRTATVSRPALAVDEGAVRELVLALQTAAVSAMGIPDAEYPRRSEAQPGHRIPPCFFYKGSAAALKLRSVGFCGSRRASDKGLAVARDCAEQLAAAGVNVVSGYAAGVDQTAHAAALAAGSPTTVVLAEGILRFRLKKALGRGFDPTHLVAVSEFRPHASWEPSRAMQRNATICGLSDAVILVEARRGSGTFAAGEAALRLGVPLFIVDFAEPTEGNEGNRELLRRGAVPLRRNPRTGRAQIDPVLDAVQAKHAEPAGQQLSLGGPPAS
jgi:DNA protecting protein DprA